MFPTTVTKDSTRKSMQNATNEADLFPPRLVMHIRNDRGTNNNPPHKSDDPSRFRVERGAPRFGSGGQIFISLIKVNRERSSLQLYEYDIASG
jgi:hypothetical protein